MIAIVIQARLSSSRLPGKVLLPIGNVPLIKHIIDRCMCTGMKVYVCTSTQASDDPLYDYLKKIDIPCFRGDLDNVLARYISCCEYFGINSCVRVTGDNPFIDFETMKSFSDIENIDYAAVTGGALGTGSEFVTLSALKKSMDMIENKDEYEHVTLYIRRNRDSFRTLFIDGDYRLKGLRLTVDEENDLVLARKIYKRLYKGEAITNEQIYNLLTQEPDLFRINIDVRQNRV